MIKELLVRFGKFATVINRNTTASVFVENRVFQNNGIHSHYKNDTPRHNFIAHLRFLYLFLDIVKT